MATALTALFETGNDEAVHVAGTLLGTTERAYGLLRSRDTVHVTEVYTRSGDLAVADRLAFVYANRTYGQVVVFELDGWYYVGQIDRHLSLEQAVGLERAGGARLLSLVCDRGITPLMAPLVRPA